jgi:putative two-component system response regulator
MKNRANEVRAQILIVDDNPLDLKLLEAVLSPKYVVCRAAGGAEALAIIESDNPPDLILLDVMKIGRASCRERVS